MRQLSKQTGSRTRNILRLAGTTFEVSSIQYFKPFTIFVVTPYLKGKPLCYRVRVSKSVSK